MTTLRGRALVGWMDRDAAIRFLLNDCAFDPPIDLNAAERLWNEHRDRVSALQPRQYAPAIQHGLTIAEAGHVKRLMAYFAGIGHADITGAKKVDLRELSVHQYHVVTERAEDYAKKVGDSQQWLSECLPLTPNTGNFGWRHQPLGLSAYIECDVPHGEWFFAPLGNGSFAPVEGLRHVTAMDAPGRTFLWAGYHRSFAKVLTTPIANAPTALLVFARNVIAPPAAPAVMPGVPMNAGGDDFSFFGAKAAKFGDFFTDGLFMDVNLRKKRYQLQVHANWVAIDDPTP